MTKLPQDKSRVGDSTKREMLRVNPAVCMQDFVLLISNFSAGLGEHELEKLLVQVSLKTDNTVWYLLLQVLFNWICFYVKYIVFHMEPCIYNIVAFWFFQ